MVFLYLRLSVTSFCGMVIMLLSKSQDMEKTAKKSNVIYEGFFTFIKRDWKAVVINILTIVVTFLIFGGVVQAADSFMQGQTYEIFAFKIPLIYMWNIFIEICFFATGYFGQDFILRRVVTSVQNNLIKDAQQWKAKISDEQTGTTEAPTPVK